MGLDILIHGAAVAAILGTGVVYGTDVFCAAVLRPALTLVDDGALVAVMGHVHRYGDRRMPVPGVLEVVAAAVTTVMPAAAGHRVQAIAAGIAVAGLVIWLLLYTRRSAPINRQLTEAAEAGRKLSNGRVLQAKWVQ